jgi:hypothetical protein
MVTLVNVVFSLGLLQGLACDQHVASDHILQPLAPLAFALPTNSAPVDTRPFSTEAHLFTHTGLRNSFLSCLEGQERHFYTSLIHKHENQF